MEETSEREKRNELGEKEKHFYFILFFKKKNHGSTLQVKNVHAFNKFIYFYLKEPAATQTDTVILFYFFKKIKQNKGCNLISKGSKKEARKMPPPFLIGHPPARQAFNNSGTGRCAILIAPTKVAPLF
jgi:hypothetical protein